MAGASTDAASTGGSAPAEPWAELFRARGALAEGHFRLSSGLHAERYVQCQAVLAWPEDAARLAAELAARLRARGLVPDVVLGPALGAIVLAHEVARALGCRSVFAERVDGAFELRRGQRLEAGERVVVAENVVTTGGSVREVLDLAARASAQPLGVAALIDRTAASADPFPGLAFVSLIRLDIPSFDPAACPRCAAGEPVRSPGSSVYLGKRPA